MTNTSPEVIAIVGPTATGKSDLALDVADWIGGPDGAEIIGVDAMALYEGMDLGTAKIPAEERRGITHHLIDVLEVSEEASVAEYQRQATHLVDSILAEQKTPIAVGGSGLYMRALLDQLQFPPTDAGVRARIEKQVRDDRLSSHRLLAHLDPTAAANIDPNNERRIIRALEVIELTGEPFSATMPTYNYHWPTKQIGLTGSLEVLDERIAKRAKMMFDSGLVDEVRNLLPQGFRQSKTASRATGYQQALAVIDGMLSVEEAVEATARATSQLARKQLKWFRRDPRIAWVDIEGPVNEKVREILAGAGVSLGS